MPLGHKVALKAHGVDESVIKYGHDIGRVVADIQVGDNHVHIHNLKDEEVVIMGTGKVLAYRRENGRVGIRNHVVILPLDDLSNSSCEKVAFNTKGCKAIPHAYGRLQFGEDLELFFRTLIGTGANPNVAAVVVIGIEPEWTNRVVEGIAQTGKPVTGFNIERHGEIKTVEMASWKAKEYMHWASELKRQECDLSEIWVSTKCGESDTTSGLASNPTVGNAFEKLVNMGATCSFGETSEITGAEMICKERAATPQGGRTVHDHF